MSEDRGSSPVACFTSAARGFEQLVGLVGADDWERPALGAWNVRDLVGHTSRSLITVEQYLGRPPTGAQLDGPVAYYLAVRSVLAGADAVAQRGRDAGAALGDDPAAAVAELVRRVVPLVEGSPLDASVASPFGSMTLVDYLPTRYFELAIHSLDLARSLDVRPPEALAPAVAAALDLAVGVAKELPEAPSILLLMTGRTGLPAGLSVV